MICVSIVLEGGGGVRDERYCGGNGGDLGEKTVGLEEMLIGFLGAREDYVCCLRLLRSVLSLK